MPFHHCYELNSIFQNSYAEALTLNVMVFGEGAFTRVKKGPMWVAPIVMGFVSL